ncbi:hypothetical protein EVAR_99894_1 [Eumeta japonica]|uniref:Uncharacterized protein n=1 Tax=Eumeta variegata TaxID=151549 RepID=A0A4C2ABA1_EUMVA|nr:hypothetical protein EVAR_99894_1 [Eumeta japonica]
MHVYRALECTEDENRRNLYHKILVLPAFATPEELVSVSRVLRRQQQSHRMKKNVLSFTTQILGCPSNDDNKIVCRVEKPKINSTIYGI